MTYDHVSSSYEHALQAAYHQIDKRGLLFDTAGLTTLRVRIADEILNLCTEISQNWQMLVHVGPIKPSLTYGRIVNVNSTSGENTLLINLKDLGYKVPKIRKKNETGEYEQKESTAELALRQLFSETGDINIKHLLRIREINKMLTTYVNAKLVNDVFYCNYNVAATVTGRRGSKKFLGFVGNNSQNFPKHSKLSDDFRRCVIARPGHIFFSVDQIQAEDWPVSALANNQGALHQLQTGVDRHTELASFIFNIAINSRTKEEWKGSIERYLGKKARHANNYGMQAKRLSEALATEGFSVPVEQCKLILERVDQYDPSVKKVFHTYIKNCLEQTRTLTTPLGRERQFFGLRPGSPNYEVFNEAFSYIPQSTVGDNTGFAVLYISGINNWIVQEGHDSIIQECPENEQSLCLAFDSVVKGFDRILKFYNGIEIQIPIEAEIGYNLKDMRKINTMNHDCVIDTWRALKAEHEQNTEGELVR